MQIYWRKKKILKSFKEEMEGFFIKIYEYRFEKTINNVPISNDKFIPKWKLPTESVPFYEFTFRLNDNIPDKI